MSPTNAAAVTLCIGRCRSVDHGHGLGLKSGDILVGVDGKRWTGSLDSLKAHLSDRSDKIVLTFQRGTAIWSVMTDRLDLGQWERLPAPSTTPFAPFATDLLCNWEIVANSDWTHDLFPLRPSVAALMAPALWLAQQRLWTLLATLGAGLAVALPAGVPVMVALWAAAGLHLWRSGTDHIRADRAGAGFHRVGVVAARSEMEAIAAWEGLRPNARFRFDGMPPRVGVPSAT
jgi:hypothetical protein